VSDHVSDQPPQLPAPDAAEPLRESIVVPGTRPGSVMEAWKLAAPTIIAQMATTMMWAVDTIMLGHVGKVEMAAAGFGGTIIWTLYTFFVGGVQAVSTFVSQAKGGGRLRECSVFTWHGIYLSLAASLLLMLAMWKFDWILALARPDPDVIHECLRYSRVRMASSFFVLGMFTLTSFFRGIGDTRTPMVAAILANVFNIIINALLIYGIGPFPRLTTLGAGLGTALAAVLSFVYLLVAYLRPKLHAVYHTRTDHPFRPRAMMRLLRVGTPMGVQFFLDMGSFTVFMAIVGRLGTDQLAASNVGIQLLSFSFMPASAVAKSGTTLVGQYLGAGRRALAERCGWVVIRMNLVYCAFIAVAFLVLRRQVFLIFNNDPGVIAAGVSIVPFLALLQIFDGLQMSYTGALQGAGDTRFPMIVFGTSSWLLFVPLAYLATLTWGGGIVGGWAVAAFHLALVSAILTVRFRSGVWKHQKI
jgi:multidrug resistance protein, MATE family